jgi:2-oxoglutarate dehydrogenase E2 component (dihydrolipoamide succinyltransferase)
LGESVTEATVAKWFKAVGDRVNVDEPLCELETDKVTVEVPAPAAGVLAAIVAAEGSDVAVGSVLGTIAESAEGVAAPPRAQPTAVVEQPAQSVGIAAPPASPAITVAPAPAAPAANGTAARFVADVTLSPAVRKLIEENRLDPAEIPATGKDGRLTKGDVLAFIERRGARPAMIYERGGAAPSSPAAPVITFPAPASEPPPAGGPVPREQRVRMTRLRKIIAARLKEAQNVAAMLTTFNEIDMTAANEIRSRYREAFEKKYNIRLGIMSIFIKACVVALKEFPAVNAEIDGDDIVYKNHYDIAIAVSSPQGLVVPVVRDADRLTFAEIEAKIADFGKRAREGRLAIEEMQGGTFTITNGGVFGSLMSTPILNPPQVGILGMHKIQQRPMVIEGGRIEARPMMYVALSYDHRLIDGREAVSFLVRVKECVEDPQRILMEC